MKVENKHTNFPVQDWEENYFCSANIWSSPSQATGNAKCFKKDFSLPINTTVAGDFCLKKQECFGNEDEVDWIEGQWVLLKTTKAWIPGQFQHKWCDVSFSNLFMFLIFINYYFKVNEFWKK